MDLMADGIVLLKVQVWIQFMYILGVCHVTCVAIVGN